ncbi:TPA: hypothetical protein N0F65_006097, partial [Lagenidium giganteum]
SCLGLGCTTRIRAQLAKSSAFHCVDHDGLKCKAGRHPVNGQRSHLRTGYDHKRLVALYARLHGFQSNHAMIRTPRFSECGRMSDDSQKNRLLQKAKSLDLADELPLRNKNARPSSDDMTSGASTASSASSDYDCFGSALIWGRRRSEVANLNVGALPPINEWVEVKPGLWFLREVDNGGKDVLGDSNSSGKSKLAEVRFHFRCVDAVIEEAFVRYREAEHKRTARDKARYMYVQDVQKCFAVKGFPHKLGLLLHGPSSTDKTSYTKRHMVTISLAKIQTNQELMNAMNDITFPVDALDPPVRMRLTDVVSVMEDIDCASSVVMNRQAQVEKEHSTSKMTEEELLSSVIFGSTSFSGCETFGPKTNDNDDKLNLAGLLNVLDSVIDAPGWIVIMTTNHPEKLDPALIRPGKVLLDMMNVKQTQIMFEYYFATKLTTSQVQQIRDAAAAAAACINDGAKSSWTSAQTEELCAEFDDVDFALERLRSSRLVVALPSGTPGADMGSASVEELPLLSVKQAEQAAAAKANVHHRWGNHNHVKGMGFVAISAFTFSVLSALIKYESYVMPSMETVFWRSFVAVLLNLVAVRSNGVSLTVQHEHRRALLSRAVFGTCSLSFGFYAMQQMVLADASVLLFTSPIMTFFLGAVVLGERINSGNFACALMSLVGVVCVVRPAFIFGTDHDTVETDDSIFAISSALLGAVCQAIVYVSMRHLTQVHYLVVIHYFLSTATVVSGLSLLLVQHQFVVPYSQNLWFSVLGTGVTGFFGQTFLTRGFQLENAGPASVMRYLDIVFVFIWDSLLLREQINVWSVVGASIITGCAVLIALRKMRGVT